MFRKFSSFFSIAVLLTFLAGCSDPAQERFEAQFVQYQKQLNLLDQQFKELKDHVDDPSKSGKYQTLLTVALGQVKSEFPDNPEINRLSETFKNDTTKDGTIYKKIETHYNEIKNHPQYDLIKNKLAKDVSYKNVDKNYFRSIILASSAVSVSVFDEHFIDYVNILASISKNVNPVEVDSVSNDAPLGSQLVGNPLYGEWVQKPDGHAHWSFFETYGMIRLIDDMLDIDGYRYRSGYRHGYDRYRYDHYSKTRNFSYSKDVHKNRYASTSNLNKYKKFESNLAKNPNYKGKSFENKTLTKQTTSMNSKASKFTPNFAKQSHAANRSSSGLNKTKQASANKYQSNLANKKSSGSFRGTSSSRSSKGGK